ncbi:MAG: PleD family two-component system response regulator [Desulfatibacillaceae bacterium]
MKVLVADDDRVALSIYIKLLEKSGFEPVAALSGTQAWEILREEDRPLIAVLDWMMPGIEGVEITRRLRELPGGEMCFVILITAKESEDHLVEGFEAGANDYLRKPVSKPEFRARLNVARRMVELQQALAERVRQLEAASRQIRTLEGFLPICAYCKKIRIDEDYWQQIEQYISTRADVHFSHSVCKDCYAKHVQPQLDEAAAEAGKNGKE